MNESIISEYMAIHYANRLYRLYEGNNCDWVSMGNIDMYFIIRNNRIIDVQVD